MKTIMNSVIEDILLYNNHTLLFVSMLAALIVILVIERESMIKLVLGVIPLAMVLVILCPIYAWIGFQFDDEVYYRIFWTLPIGIMVCYAIVKLMMICRKKLAKAVILVLSVIIIVINGSCYVTNTPHFVAHNRFHIPDIVVFLMNELSLDEYRAKAVLPNELLPFFRQYDAGVMTPYGREVLEAGWQIYYMEKSELYKAMNEETYDTARISQAAKDEMCAFVVLNSLKPKKGDMSEYGYFLKGTSIGYEIYMNYDYYAEMKRQGVLTQEEMEQIDEVLEQYNF